MERCSKCSGVMLLMKAKKTLLSSDVERKQIFRCSRCGFYLEKQQLYSTVDKDERDGTLYPPYGGRK